MSRPLNGLKGLLLDLDGTLYVSGKLLDATPRLFATLARLELPFLCLTNNSSARGADYVAKLQRFGLRITAEQVLTSGQATIDYVLRDTPCRSAFIVGTDSFRAECAAAGLACDEQDPDCLIVAYDTSVDYHKLSVATRLLFAEKPYFATHPDRTCISDRGLLPDIAATIAGLEAVTGRLPLVIGKPEQPMIAAAARRLGRAPGELAMVGDQLDTDMTMAARHGLTGILVLSGETSRQQLDRSEIRPAFVFADVGGLAAALEG